MTWPSVADATSYTLQRAKNYNFSDATNVYTGAGTSTSQSISTGGTYYYRVRASNDCGTSAWWVGSPIMVRPLPDAPSTIDYPSAICANIAFTVSWPSVTGATGYTLQRATNSSFSDANTVYSGTSTSTTETISTGGTYYYRVSASNECGLGAWRTGSSILVKPIPAAPSTISYPSSGCANSPFTVSWPSVPGATGYTLQRATSSSFSDATNVYTGAGTSTSQSLAAGTYYYRVSASNECGTSGWRSGSSIIVKAIPATPSSISYPSSGCANSPFTVSWPSVPDATSYTLQRATSSTFSGATNVYTGGATSTIETISTAGTYYYRIRASNECGTSGWTSGSSIVVKAIPATPSSISYPSTGCVKSAFTVSWPSVTGATGYTLQRATNSSFSDAMNVYTGATTPTTQTISIAGTYYYRVSATNECGTSGWKSGPSIVVRAIPDSPASLSYPSSGCANSAFTVSWPSVTGATNYTLERATNSSFSGVTNAYTGASTSTSQSLGTGTYYYRVRASNDCGTSDWKTGSPIEVKVLPSAPSSISYPSTGCANSPFTVSWPSVTGATGYTLQRATSSTFSGATNVYTGAATSTTETISTAGTYYYRVSATNECGTSGWRSGSSTVVKPIPASPSSITNPSTGCVNSVFTVSWPSVTGATGYTLQRATNSIFSDATNVYTGATTSTTQTISTAGTYYYRVSASNDCGAGDWKTGSPIEIKPLPVAPSSTSYPSSGCANSAFTVSWPSVTGATSYTLQRATNPSFSGATNAYTGASTSASQSLGAGTYYYRVRASNGCGISEWRTGSPIEVKVLPSAPGSIGYPSTGCANSPFTVSWPSVTGASRYILERATNQNFGDAIEVYSGPLGSISQSVSAGTYYYRVKAANECGATNYKNGPAITVRSLPGPISSIFYSANSICESDGLTVNWSNVAYAENYVLQKATNSAFTDARNVYSGMATSYADTFAAPGTYYYRVKAMNGCGEVIRVGSSVAVNSCGSLSVNISPRGAVDDGAQWRVDGGAWQSDGAVQRGIGQGECTLEFKNITGWNRPMNQRTTITRNETAEATGFYTPATPLKGVLEGLVSAVNAQGQPLGPISGATVELSGHGSSITDAQGKYRFPEVNPGTYTVSASKPGYYAVTKSIILKAGEAFTEVFRLTKQEAATRPIITDSKSPNGKHFVEGIPGDLGFEATIAWNGSPGTVLYQAAGKWYPASKIISLGGGTARATLSIPAPRLIDTCSELIIEVINGEGEKTSMGLGVHFSPIFGIIPWYEDDIWWTPSGLIMSYSTEKSWDWDLDWKIGSAELGASLGYGWEIKYDLLSATLSGSLEGTGGFGFELPTPNPKINILGEAELNLGGELGISMAGCGSPKITPSLSLSFDGKVGLEAPAVVALDAFVYGLGTGLAKLPVVKDIQLGIYFIFGGSLTGEFETSSRGSCVLGAKSYSGEIMGGVEGIASFESKLISGELTLGGKGTLDIDLCPRFAWNSFKGILYADLNVEIFGLFPDPEWGPYTHEFYLNLSKTLGARKLAITEPSRISPAPKWTPIGRNLLKWGKMNRLVDDIVPLRSFMALEEGIGFNGDRSSPFDFEEKIVENVIRLSAPVVHAEDRKSMILFVQHDTEKPWYAATDIAQLIRTGTAPWSMDRVTDNLAAEFSPEIKSMNADTLLAVWTRVDGDVSAAESPEEIAPHLEIVSARYDRTSGRWIEPVQLTNNGQVDRDPLLASYGNTIGALWIQNQGNALLGDASQGDSLMFSSWNGSAWSTSVPLWSAQKGVLEFSFAGDDAGQGHVVLAVDEDGDLETVEDRDLYLISTVGGVWQAPEKLTDDAVEDSLAVLLAVKGSPMLVWKAGQTLKYTFLAQWSPSEVYREQMTNNEAPTLSGVALPGGAALAYTVQSPDGIDIVAAFYDAALDIWSLPRRLTHDDASESSLSMGFDGQDLVITYLKTATLRENVETELDGKTHVIENVPRPGRTDLYVLRHALGYDLAVAQDSLVFDPANPAPGSTAEISVTVENRGDLPAQNVAVSFYDGDPDQGGTLINQTTIKDLLIAGGRKQVRVSWRISDDPNSRVVYVVADPEMSFDDRDRSNNLASARTVLPDLIMETNRHDWVSNSSVALTATIGNQGMVPTSLVEVCWRLGGEYGEELDCVDVESIAPGARREATLIWDSSQQKTPDSSVVVYAVVDPQDALLEINESNNVGMQAIAWGKTQQGLGDLIMILQIVTGKEAPGVISRLDLDSDGRIGISDAIMLLQCVGETRSCP